MGFKRLISKEEERQTVGHRDSTCTWIRWVAGNKRFLARRSRVLGLIYDLPKSSVDSDGPKIPGHRPSVPCESGAPTHAQGECNIDGLGSGVKHTPSNPCPHFAGGEMWSGADGPSVTEDSWMIVRNAAGFGQGQYQRYSLHFGILIEDMIRGRTDHNGRPCARRGVVRRNIDHDVPRPCRCCEARTET